MRPRIALSVIDCTLAHHLASGSDPAELYERQVVDAHRMFARWTRIDGVYSWYQAFVDVARDSRFFGTAALAAARYCFADIRRFAAGAKQPLVVFAGRFSTQKRPLLFIDAVAALHRRDAELARAWRFAMYGGGPLEAQVRARIAEHGLADRIDVGRTPDLAPVFARSKLMVSTQAYENFTSLAVLEAMAAGNAVIAERVGQSDEFVRDGENGYLVSPATADGFAEAMARYMRSGDHARLAAASRNIATRVHTIEHFATDITAFWRRLVTT